MLPGMDAMMYFLVRLKKYLEAKRGRKAQLARDLRVSAGTVSNWCRLIPERMPDGSNALLILRWLQEQGLPVSDFLPPRLTATVVGERKPRGGPPDGGRRTKAMKQRRPADAVSPYSPLRRAGHLK